MTKYIIYFVYDEDDEERYCCREFTGTEEGLRGNIKYWLGKSPGSYPCEPCAIRVVEEDDLCDYSHVIDDLREEEAEYEEKMQEARDKAQYERLKAKYG